MRSLRPVVWREGMHLAHHHFQLRDRFFEDSAAFAFDSLVFKAYGLTRLELEREALLNGTVRIAHAAGIMPDGLPFSFPDDEPPPDLDVREIFAPTQQSHRVLLTIPAYRPDEAMVASSEDAHEAMARYVSHELLVADETTGQDEKRIQVGRKNFRLRLDVEEVGPETVSMEIARVRRDRAGNYEYDPDHIAPALHIGASGRITSLLHRMIEMMESKSSTLMAERSPIGNAADLGADEIVNFWLSHAIQSSVAPLRHHLHTRAAHPEETYRELLRFAGALCTFSLEARPETLPSYDHDNLTETFGALERHIREHFDVVLPRRALRVALEPIGDFCHIGVVPSLAVTGDTHWYLEVQVTGSHAAAISDVSRLVKVCVATLPGKGRGDAIKRLSRDVIPGLETEHVATPPSDVSPRIGTEYFRIIRGDSPCWKGLQMATQNSESVEVGLYVPEALADQRIGLLIAQTE